MKRVRSAVAIVLLAAVLAMALGACVPPAPPEDMNFSKWCKDHDDFPAYFDSHGDCVSTLIAYHKENPGGANLVGICKFFDNYDYRNQGACVKALREAGY